MKGGYTGHPDLPRLMLLEDKLQEQVNDMRFNSEGQAKDAQLRLNELRDEIRKLQLQGR